MYPRRGTFAAEVNIADLTDVCDIRLVLEPHAAMRAAQAATEANRNQLRDVISKIQGFVVSGQGNEPLMYLDMLAHRTVYRCTGNVYLEYDPHAISQSSYKDLVSFRPATSGCKPAHSSTHRSFEGGGQLGHDHSGKACSGSRSELPERHSRCYGARGAFFRLSEDDGGRRYSASVPAAARVFRTTKAPSCARCKSGGQGS